MNFIEKHPKTAAIFMVIGVALITVAICYGAAVWLSQHPSSAEVSESLALTATLDGVAFPDQTAVNWGTVTASTQYTKTLAITNSGNLAKTLTVTFTNLPSGWACVWSQNGNSVAPGATLSGTLTLTVSASPTAQTYSWTTNLNGV